MTWVTLNYSKKQVDAAGEVIARIAPDTKEFDEAIEVLSNWRAAHGFALNTVQLDLRRRSRNCCDEPLIAQRLKRAPSIITKLRRFPDMNLARMQDIAGCRAVVDSVSQVRKLESLYTRGRTIVLTKPPTDYISKPKVTGYRGIHLICRFQGTSRSKEYGGRLVEVQLRTRTQHAWATAVETVDAVLNQSLKSNQGSTDWSRFFALAGSAFAVDEGCPPVEGLEDMSAVATELRSLFESLKVRTVLAAYRDLTQVFQQQEWKKSYYFILHLELATRRLTIYGFKKDEVEAAAEKYQTLEREEAALDGGTQTVLVAADSLKALRRAYPNYYLDTHAFVSKISHILKVVQ